MKNFMKYTAIIFCIISVLSVIISTPAASGQSRDNGAEDAPVSQAQTSSGVSTPDAPQTATADETAYSTQECIQQSGRAILSLANSVFKLIRTIPFDQIADSIENTLNTLTETY